MPVPPALLATVLKALDTMARDVTFWESTFLDTLRRQRRPLTPKQEAVLLRMADKYLDPLVAAELRGQQRLFYDVDALP